MVCMTEWFSLAVDLNNTVYAGTYGSDVFKSTDGTNQTEINNGLTNKYINSLAVDSNNHDVKPIIVNDRTMLPLRFVAESLGCEVGWDNDTRTITITYGG